MRIRDIEQVSSIVNKIKCDRQNTRELKNRDLEV